MLTPVGASACCQAPRLLKCREKWKEKRGKDCLNFSLFPLLFPLPLSLLYLTKIEFHRRQPAEDGDVHAQLALLEIDVFHRAVEIGKRVFLDTHHFARLERKLGPRLFHRLLHLVPDRKSTRLNS